MPDLSVLGNRLTENPPLSPSPRGRLEGRWRRRHRRRLALAGAGAVAAAGLVAGGLVSAGGGTRVQVVGPPATRGSSVQPAHPTALAVGPDGVIYIADPQLNEILERLHDGRFAVLAGTGLAGFSGDGGPARDAALNDPSGMAVGPDGSLYFADQGNHRVRAIGVDGRIMTVAGGGTTFASGYVRGGTPALSSSFSPSDVAFGPGGRLYIATGEQVVRLGTDGTLTPVLGAPPANHQGVWGIGGPAVDGSADGANGIAFDSAGNLYVAGFNTKALLVVRPDGILQQVSSSFYPRGDGGLATTPNGQVIAMDALSVDAVTPSAIQPVFSFQLGLFQGIHAFSPNGIAVGNDGTIYLDTGGNGYSNQTALAALAPTFSSSSLLWELGAPPPVRVPNAPGVLQGDGIGAIAFGQDEAAVVTALEHLVGRPGTTLPAVGPPACGVDYVVHWADLDAYFFRGRFVGYGTHTSLLATEAGVRVGQALPFAQHLYESSIVTSFEQGGAWFVATPWGELEGLLSSEPNQGGTTPRIASIEAGSVGCPAQTP